MWVRGADVYCMSLAVAAGCHGVPRLNSGGSTQVPPNPVLTDKATSKRADVPSSMRPPRLTRHGLVLPGSTGVDRDCCKSL